jgi:hypothetical protein
MTDFKPVFLDGPLDRRLRQTWLRHFNNCPRSAFLAVMYEGQSSTPEMMRGTAAHEIFARATRLAMEMGEATIPPDVVKTLADEVLGEFPVPLEQHDYVREMAFRWASEVAFDPGYVVACETLFEWPIGEWKVRARIDFAEILEDGHALLIRDYKSSRAAPPWDEVARKMPDGRLVAKNFQLVLYALVMAFGVPVREEECSICAGLGYVYDIPEHEMPAPGAEHRDCMRCEGTGRTETPEPFSIAKGVNRFDLEFVYPGIEDREGKMVRRPLTLDRLELEEYRTSVEGLVGRVRRAEQSGDWPAVTSDAACSECPAPGECPILQEVRNWRGRINTPEQASEAAMVLDRQKAELRAAQTELRNFAKETGEPIRFGGKVMELVYAESEQLDKDALFDALSRGETVDWGDYISVKGRTDFKARDLTADEREAQDG